MSPTAIPNRGQDLYRQVSNVNPPPAASAFSVLECSLPITMASSLPPEPSPSHSGTGYIHLTPPAPAPGPCSLSRSLFIVLYQAYIQFLCFPWFRVC